MKLNDLEDNIDILYSKLKSDEVDLPQGFSTKDRAFSYGF